MSRRLKDIEQACERCGRARPDPRWVSPGGVAPRPSDFSPARLGLRLSLYRDVAAITCNKRDLPRFPEQLPSHPVPTTPESPPASSRLSPQMAAAFPT